MNHRFAPAAERNRDAILAVLNRILPSSGTVLEVASGTGQHVAAFASAFPSLRWQPSDPDAEARASIAAWCGEAGVTNVSVPLMIDVTQPAWEDILPAPITAIVCINLLHIAPWYACEGLMRGAATALPEGAPLYLYGPYKRAGQHTAPSNAAFDQSLRARNPAWGVRDLDEVSACAASHGLRRADIIEMPANNFSVVFRRRAEGSRLPH